MDLDVKIDGRRVHMVAAGEGEPALFVHGFPLAAGMWRPQLDAVPRGWRFIAPDLRGFGGSERCERGTTVGATTLEAHAHDLVALLDHLELECAVVVALSMGGYIAQALVAMAPKRVAALVLCDTRSEADSPETAEGRRALREQVNQKGMRAAADAMLPRMLGETSKRQRTELEPLVRGIIERNPPEGIVDALIALMTRPDQTAGLAGISCPTLLIVGDEDAITPVASHEKMRDAIRGSELVVIPAAGHLPNLEQPQVFNTALQRFLSQR
jgi:pimeloyl-ACP methyl ester carboxylesterase